MNILKRACSIVLVAALIVSVFAVAVYTGVSAEEPATAGNYGISVYGKPVKENGEVSVDLKFYGEAYGTQFVVSYDKDVLTPSAITTTLDSEKFVFEPNDAYDEGKLFIMVFGSETIPAGVIATVKFTAAAGTAGSDVAINVEDAVITDSTGETVDPTVAPVTVTNSEITVFPAAVANPLEITNFGVILGSDVTLKAITTKAIATDPAYSDMYAVFSLGARTSDHIAPVVSKTYGSNYYEFEFKNINPYELGKEIKVTLYAKYNGVEYHAPQRTYSIVEYCGNQFPKTTINDATKTLMAEMLNYGTAVQNYVEKAKLLGFSETNTTGARINLDTRVAAYVAQYETKTAVDPAPFSCKDTAYQKVENPKISWVGSTLSLGSAVAMQFVFKANQGVSYDGVTFKVIDSISGNVKKEYTQADFQVYSGSNYLIDFREDWGVAFMRRPVYVAAFDSQGNQISDTYRYSIESYAVGKTGDIGTLCEAMVKYGRAAEKVNNVTYTDEQLGK